MGTPCAAAWAVLGEAWSCSSHLVWAQASSVGLAAMRSLANASEKQGDTGLCSLWQEIPQLNGALEKPHQLDYPLGSSIHCETNIKQIGPGELQLLHLCKALDICIISCPSFLHNLHHISWPTLDCFLPLCYILAAGVFCEEQEGSVQKRQGWHIIFICDWGRYFDMTFIFTASD